MEAERFDRSMEKYERSAIRIWTSLGFLNFGQAVIFIVMFGVSYLGVLVVTIWLYLYFTIKASNWRISIRRD